MSSPIDSKVARLRELVQWPELEGTRYRIEGELARGGMGVVYEAEDLQLHRRVALKVLPLTDLRRPDAAERLLREAEVIARLEHPGIVPVHDAGRMADGRTFYAMKLVRGLTLSAALRSERSLADLLRIFLRLCEAVAFAHAHGVVHRDLKPDNIMLGEFGEVLIMDWGVAKSNLGESEPSKPSVVGTPGFMAPEQERGESDRADARSDVFALGTILRLLVAAAGERPNRRLRGIMRMSTAAAPDDRYADGGQLADDVARYLDGRAVRAHREGYFERVVRWLDHNRALVGMLLAYLIMRAAILLWARL